MSRECTHPLRGDIGVEDTRTGASPSCPVLGYTRQGTHPHPLYSQEVIDLVWGVLRISQLGSMTLDQTEAHIYELKQVVDYQMRLGAEHWRRVEAKAKDTR